MNTYINSFVRGRELLKKLLVSDMVTAIIAIIYVDIKYCRCPNCGKVILLGVLAINTCPRCKHSLTTGKKVKKGR